MKSWFNVEEIKKDVKEKNPIIKKEKEKVLESSIKEGAFASISFNTGPAYITPFALAINSSPFQIGLLSSIVGIASPIAQLFGNEMIKRKSRKKVFLNFTLLEALAWLPLIAVIYMFKNNILPEYLPYFLILNYTLIGIFLGAGAPAWFSWMGDIVPENSRGKYFSQRNKITSIFGLVSLLTVGYILDLTKTKGYVLIGFTIIFAISCIARLISHCIIKKQFNPYLKFDKKTDFTFIDFMKRYDNFGRFSMYRTMLFFSRMIAIPFFTVYMLKNLQFSYLTFTLVTISGTLFYIIFTPLMGRFSDRYGNLKLMQLATILWIITPIFWMIFENPIALIFIPQLIGGIAMAADTIGTNNFIYDSVSPKHRGNCVSYLGLLNGIGIFLGSLVGGLIMKYNPSMFEPIMVVFFASALFRFITAIAFLPKIKEWKRFEKLPKMHFSIKHPLETLNSEISWIKKIVK
jgi:MFS family permease